jgi:prefoldin subunit 5
MSSPLDNRIRSIARSEATALLGAPGGVQVAASSAPTASQMQQQITDLHEHLHHAAATISRLSDRLDALEKAAGQTDTARRTARKTSG